MQPPSTVEATSSEHQRRWRSTTTVSAALGIVAILGTIVVGWVISDRADAVSHATDSQGRVSATSVARRVAESIDGQVAGVQSILANNIEIFQDAEACAEFFAVLGTENPLYFVDPSDTVYCSTDPGLLGTHEPSLRDVLAEADAPAVYEPPTALDGEYSVRLVAELGDGYLASVRYSVVSVVRSASIPAEAAPVLVAPGDAAFFDGEPAALSDVRVTASGAGTAVLTLPSGDTERVWLQPVESSLDLDGWFGGVVLDTSAVDADFSAFRLRVGLLSGSLIAILGVVVIVVRSRLTAPLAELTAGATTAVRSLEATVQTRALPIPEQASSEVADLATAFNELLAARSSATRALTDMREAERRRLADALHGDAIQHMAATELMLRMVRKKVVNGCTDDELDAGLDRVAHLLRESVVAARRVLGELHPAALQQYGLRHALDGLIEDTGIPAEVDIGELPDRSEQVDLAIFRVVQEALRNVEKHAQASRVVVEITGDDKVIRGRIADDGVGIDAMRTEPDGEAHLGVSLMEHNIAELDGTFWIESTRSGTEVHFELPIV